MCTAHSLLLPLVGARYSEQKSDNARQFHGKSAFRIYGTKRQLQVYNLYEFWQFKKSKRTVRMLQISNFVWIVEISKFRIYNYMDTWLYKLIITRILQIYFTFTTGTLHYIGNFTDFEKGETRLVTPRGVPHTIPESRNSETVESREKFH